MIIGVPKEIKDNEYRVALTPAAAETLVHAGHAVLVQAAAGEGSGFPDAEFTAAGAKLLPDAAAVFAQAEMIMKVKEPQAVEYEQLLRPGQLLFTYLHLAAEDKLARALVKRGINSVAYETVVLPNGTTPMLTPMSEVAGRMAVQVAAHYLERAHGGRGKLLGGVPGVRPADVVIIGGGVVGSNAARIALGMGAHVTVLDLSGERLRYLADVLHGNLTTLASNRRNIADTVRVADVVIGAVLIPGARAPRLVTREMISTMNPGSVVVDVAIDQGGCIETIRPTSHSEPVYLVDGVVHYGVTNMPGAVARTSTYALSNATLPYALRIAGQGFANAAAADPALAQGANTWGGKLTHAAVAEALGMQFTPLRSALN